MVLSSSVTIHFISIINNNSNNNNNNNNKNFIFLIEKKERGFKRTFDATL